MNAHQSNTGDKVNKLFLKNDVNPANINNFIILEKYKKQQHYLNKLLLVNYSNDEIQNIKLPINRVENMKRIQQEDALMVTKLKAEILELSNKIKHHDDSPNADDVTGQSIDDYKIRDGSNLVSKMDLKRRGNQGENDVAVSSSYWDNEYKQYYEKVEHMKEEAEKLKQQRILKEKEEKELLLKQQQQQTMFSNPMLGLYGMDLDLNFNKTEHDTVPAMANNNRTANPIAADTFVMGTTSNPISGNAAPQDMPPQPSAETKIPSTNDNDFLMNDFEFDDLDLNNANDFSQDFNDDELDPAFF